MAGVRKMGVSSLLSVIEQKRVLLSRSTEAKKKSQFGQFLTPERTAAFMAGRFPGSGGRCCFVCSGAGSGSLFSSVL